MSAYQEGAQKILSRMYRPVNIKGVNGKYLVMMGKGAAFISETGQNVNA